MPACAAQTIRAGMPPLRQRLVAERARNAANKGARCTRYQPCLEPSPMTRLSETAANIRSKTPDRLRRSLDSRQNRVADMYETGSRYRSSLIPRAFSKPQADTYLVSSPL